MSRKLQLVGFFVEDQKDGPKIVLVQPYTHADGRKEEIEHETGTPEELWNAFVAIMGDPGEDAEQHPAPDDQHDDSPGGGPSPLVQAGLDEAQILVEQTAGPVAGRIAGAIMRNPAQARAIGQRVADVLRSVSRGQRQPRVRRNR